jgi:hypothetical protein
MFLMFVLSQVYFVGRKFFEGKYILYFVNRCRVYKKIAEDKGMFLYVVFFFNLKH